MGVSNYTYSFDELTPGKILACSWGYSMTIVDFYRVVGRWGKAHVTLEKLANKVVKGDGWAGECVPDTDVVRDRITNAFYSKKFGCIRLDSSRGGLRIWDGNPAWFDHLD